MWRSIRRRKGPIGDLRRAIAARPLRPFEYLEIAPRPGIADAIVSAKIEARGGFRFAGDEKLPLSAPVDWEFGARSVNFHVHAFMPVNAQLAAHSLTGRRRPLKRVRDVMLDWLEANLTETGDLQTNETLLADPHPSRWYDMAVGQRVYKFAYLLDVLARSRFVADRTIARLADAIRLHHRLLADPRLFKPHNNHGFFQALTQLAAATRLPELDDDGHAARARDRLTAMVDRQFHADGIHAEHSPGYHFMVTTALINARNAGVLDAELSARVGRFESLMGHFVDPHGRVAAIGDTDPRRYWKFDRFVGFFGDPAMRFLVSGGAEGEAPATGVFAFPESGYAIARSDWNGSRRPLSFYRQSYLIHEAAFHSRTHKQADHLTFAWHERARAILVDPGRYAYAGQSGEGGSLMAQGFYYSDPKRIYVESTRAHNCLEIDGASHDRIGVAPFGSGLRQAGLQGEIAVIESTAELARGLTQRRTLLLRPGHFLIVLDHVAGDGEPHDFRQWFCVGSGWEVSGAGNAVAGIHSAGHSWGLRFLATSLIADRRWSPPVRGQTEPELLGWRSDTANSLVPATSLCLSQASGPSARFATLFTLAQACEIDRAATNADATLDTADFKWRDSRGEHRLIARRDEHGQRRIEFSSSWRRRLRPNPVPAP